MIRRILWWILLAGCASSPAMCPDAGADMECWAAQGGGFEKGG